MSWIATKGRTGNALHMAVNGRLSNSLREIVEIIRKIIELYTELNMETNIQSKLNKIVEVETEISTAQEILTRMKKEIYIETTLIEDKYAR